MPEDTAGLEPAEGRSGGLDGAMGAGALAATLLGVSIGAQLILAAMFLLESPPVATEARELTPIGEYWHRPENDLKIYLVGCLASGLLVAVLWMRWLGRARLGRDGSREGALGLAVAWVLAAASTAAIFAGVVVTQRQALAASDVPLWAAALAVGPALAGLAFGLIGIRPVRGRGRIADRLSALGAAIWSTDPGQPPSPGGRAFGGADWAWSAAALGAVALLISIPTPARVAGNMVDDAVPFHHWDFFAMGPAAAYRHGLAMETEVFSQYGVAWPALLSWLDPVVPLSHGNAMHLGMLYGCVYYLGIFVALRLYLGHGGWALLGMLGAIALTVHLGTFGSRTIWITPSSTVLRTPMDVWFFAALVMHQRRGGPGWLLSAGVLAGMAVLFALDVGLCLAAVLVFYSACQVLVRRPDQGGRLGAVAPLLAPALATATVLAGLAIVSRGTIARPEFWRGWLESVRLYGGGMAALPMAVEPHEVVLLAFLGMMGSYLALFWLAVLRVLWRRAGGELLLGAALAAYGLELLVIFVNRSHNWNLVHQGIPFVVLAACGPARLLGVPRRGSAAVPAALCALVLGALALNPEFRSYPGLLRAMVAGPPPRGLCLGPDICGLPESRREYVEQYRGVTRRMAEIRDAGGTVAVLDPGDTIFYLGSGVVPADRYHSLLTIFPREPEDRLARERFRAAAPGFVVMRRAGTEADGGQLAPLASWGPWRALLIEMGYEPGERIGDYDIWRLGSPRPEAGD